MPEPPVSELEREVVERTAALVAALDAELEALRRRRDALNSAIAALARKRNRYAPNGAASRPADRPAKTTATELVLQEISPREMRVRDLHEELVSRGWSDDTPRERHALEVAVRSLEISGRAARPRRGWYAVYGRGSDISEAA